VQITKFYQDFDIHIFNDESYDPGSGDHANSYDKIYGGKSPYEYSNLTKHGVRVFKDGVPYRSALLINGFGGTGIHETGLVTDIDKLLICCADSVFCLTLPELDLFWNTQADMATCFEIFRYQGNYIVHGEMEISRLDQEGKIIWQCGGMDIFTTLNGKDDFKIEANKIIATDWGDRKYIIDPETGKSELLDK